MRRTDADDRTPPRRQVADRQRPAARAATPARRTGASTTPDALRRRIEEAHRRMEEEAASRPRITRLAARRPARPAAPRAQKRNTAPAPAPAPAPRRARAIAHPSPTSGVFGPGGLAAVRAEPLPEEEARPRHLKVVKPGTLSAAQRRRRARAVLIAGIGAMSFIAFALVYLHVVLAQRQFQIDHLNSQVTQAQTAHQDLRLKVAELGSPQHVISTAEGRLGMVQPSKVVYLTPNQAGATGAGTSAQASRGGSGSTQTKTQPAGTP